MRWILNLKYLDKYKMQRKFISRMVWFFCNLPPCQEWTSNSLSFDPKESLFFTVSREPPFLLRLMSVSLPSVTSVRGGHQPSTPSHHPRSPLSGRTSNPPICLEIANPRMGRGDPTKTLVNGFAPSRRHHLNQWWPNLLTKLYTSLGLDGLMALISNYAHMM